jgi:hypothetical protein
MRTRSIIFTTVVLLIPCFLFVPDVRAVTPAPDGGYPGGNTAEGQNALLGLTTGGYNTAVGYLSVLSDTGGSFNTAVGAGTLLTNSYRERSVNGLEEISSAGQVRIADMPGVQRKRGVGGASSGELLVSTSRADFSDNLRL